MSEAVVTKVVPISKDISWSEAACLNAMQERAENLDGVLVVGFQKDGPITWGSANLTRNEMAWLIMRFQFLLASGEV